MRVVFSSSKEGYFSNCTQDTMRVGYSKEGVSTPGVTLVWAGTRSRIEKAIEAAIDSFGCGGRRLRDGRRSEEGESRRSEEEGE